MKIIVCDMSGIASSKGVNNEKLLNTLNNLKNYCCTFCTGKGYLGGYETLKSIDMKIPFICENGSVIVDKGGNVIYSDKMNSSKVANLIYELSKMPFEFLAYVDLKTQRYKFLKGTKKLTENLNQPWFYSEEIYDDVNDFLNNIDKENVCRITTRGLELDENVEELKDFHIVVSEKEFHSICNKGTNKGFGVEKLAEICNVEMKDIVIIGNDLNDIDMFKLKDCYKIATGENTPPKELQDLANIYIPLDELPDYLAEIDKKNNIC